MMDEKDMNPKSHTQIVDELKKVSIRSENLSL